MAAALLKAVAKANAAVGGHSDVSFFASVRQNGSDGGEGDIGGDSRRAGTGTGPEGGGHDNQEVRSRSVFALLAPTWAVSPRGENNSGVKAGHRRSFKTAIPIDAVMVARVDFFASFSPMSRTEPHTTHPTFSAPRETV